MGTTDGGWVEVQPDAVCRVVDRLHEENIGGLHHVGFCEECAIAGTVLYSLTGDEIRAIVNEFHAGEFA